MEMLTYWKTVPQYQCRGKKKIIQRLSTEKIFIGEKGKKWRADNPKSHKGTPQTASMQRSRVPSCSEGEWSCQHQVNYSSRAECNAACPRPRKSFKYPASFERNTHISKRVSLQSLNTPSRSKPYPSTNRN